MSPRGRTLAVAGAMFAASGAWACRSRGAATAAERPFRLVRPAAAPLSAAAAIGRAIFFDSTLSASGRVSCATCHDPAHAYAPAGDLSSVNVARGAPAIVRNIPSLRYVYRTPPFSVGPMLVDADEPVSSRTTAAPRKGAQAKVANAPSNADRVVAHGGLFWDGRVNTLQDQAMGPLFNPAEMANRDETTVASRIKRQPYAAALAQLFGEAILRSPARLIDEAMFAVARFQLEDSTFRPYSSKYDAYLEGRAELAPAERRGLRAFDDPKRGNCAACHIDKPGLDNTPPAFTDYEYEALGVPRNAANARPGVYDLGACGPVRTDLKDDPRYCGLFRTPSLRNVATRHAFFHNGVYRTLEDVLAFYNDRDTRPNVVYPATRDGSVAKYNDLPARYQANVDVVDAPFDRRVGDPPPMTEKDIADIIAFLKTLTDGYAATTARSANGSLRSTSPIATNGPP